MLDPSLTLTRTQHPAIVSNPENRKRFTYARFASVCNAQQPLTAHSWLEQVSGSSPLVGSLFCCDLQVKRKPGRTRSSLSYSNRTATRARLRTILRPQEYITYSLQISA